MSPQSRWLLPEPAFLFAFLSRQRSPWLFTRKKKGSISTFCVKGDRLLLLYHWGTVPCISCGRHSGSTTEGKCWCVTSLTLYCLFERMSWLVLFFLYEKKKATNGQLGGHLRSWLYPPHLSLRDQDVLFWNGTDYVQCQSWNSKIALTTPPPKLTVH